VIAFLLFTPADFLRDAVASLRVPVDEAVERVCGALFRSGLGEETERGRLGEPSRAPASTTQGVARGRRPGRVLLLRG
jgi:hypothetical protein